MVGNPIARVFMDHSFNVTCTDIKAEDGCRFRYTLEPYIKKYSTIIYFSDHPESFLTESNYMIPPPPSLPKTSKLFKKIKENGTNIKS